MTQPNAPHEDTPLWATMSRAVADLERNGDLALRSDARHVIAFLCERVAATGLLRDPALRPAPGTRAGLAAFLESVARGGVTAADWQEHVGLQYADVAVEEARRQAVMLRMRMEQGTVSAEQAVEYFRALARGLREAAT